MKACTAFIGPMNRVIIFFFFRYGLRCDFITLRNLSAAYDKKGTLKMKLASLVQAQPKK